MRTQLGTQLSQEHLRGQLSHLEDAKGNGRDHSIAVNDVAITAMDFHTMAMPYNALHNAAMPDVNFLRQLHG